MHTDKHPSIRARAAERHTVAVVLKRIRPTIVLNVSSPGFDDPSNPKNVLKIHNTGRENDHMNQMLRGIDFEVQAGNRGAVALFQHGAQGSGVQDSTVRMVDGQQTRYPASI